MDSFWERSKQALNVDLSHRCPLECSLCGRQRHFTYKGLNVPGKDISLEDFDKLSNHFKKIAFVGQYSDPIHHPKFLDILNICKEKNILTEVNTASSFKTETFYEKAFKTYSKAKWIFGIDGLPFQSHLYRVNQDGEKLFNMMLESRKYLDYKPVWQFIIFKYNEDYIDNAIQIARDIKVDFKLINSARWGPGSSPLKPKRVV